MNRRFVSLGFTLVELMVVVGVIGLLMAITMVSYSGVNKRAVAATMQSDLSEAASTLKLYQADHWAYPTLVDSCPTPTAGNLCLKASPGNTYAWTVDNIARPNAYTLTVTNTNGLVYAVSNNQAPADRNAIPSGLVAASSVSTVINLSWTVLSGATGYTAQCASDTAYTVGMKQSTSTPTTVSITGLSPSSPYYCRVKATYTVGSSGWSTDVAATTAAPDPIVAHTLAFPASGTFTVPATTTSVTLEAWGGSDSYGDWGGYAKGTLAVTAGNILSVTITASYSDQGGYAQITRAGTNAIIATGGYDTGYDLDYDCGYGYTYASVTAPLAYGCSNSGVAHALFTYNTGTGN